MANGDSATCPAVAGAANHKPGDLTHNCVAFQVCEGLPAGDYEIKKAGQEDVEVMTLDALLLRSILTDADSCSDVRHKYERQLQRFAFHSRVGTRICTAAAAG